MEFSGSSAIDFDRYPIDKRSSQEYADFLLEARRNLAEAGILKLPNFVPAAALHAIQRECTGLACSLKVERNQLGRRTNCYYMPGDTALPDYHPQNTFFDRPFGVLRDDMLGPSPVSTIRRVYDDPHLVAFVADILEVGTLFQSRDAYQALTVNVMGEGDNLHWHFDCNACAVTIGIQAPESGGEFEYAPCIGRENHSAIQHVMSSRRSPCHLGDAVPPEHAEYVPTHLCAPGEGTLTFFRGGASLHRVKPVHGSRLRLVAALQFHTSDDSFDPPAISQLIYGVQPADHLGPKLRVVGFPSSSGQLLSA